jgi:hypothetical protein
MVIFELLLPPSSQSDKDARYKQLLENLLAAKVGVSHVQTPFQDASLSIGSTLILPTAMLRGAAEAADGHHHT